jgi:hypothetical protein
MALLNPQGRDASSLSTGRRRAAAVLLGTFVASCMLIEATGGKPPLRFSHRVHVVKEGLDCTDCHRTAATQDDPGMPALRQCLLCHEELDAKKPPERGVGTLFDGKDYRAAHASRLESEILFSHRQHAAGDTKCAECHAGIEENDSIDESIAVRMDSCTACHAGKAVADECSSCHREIRADVAPDTHQHHWLRQHGKVVRAHGAATADRCSLCHDESTCADCHLNVRPESHNLYFLRRGHGLIARMDRETCAACHRSDSCDRCHSETRPMSHTGAWGSTLNRHCLTCHFPLASSGCQVCHQGTPSHALAAPLPPGHNPGMNCRQCHGQTAPLPHVDKGDQCIACHR